MFKWITKNKLQAVKIQITTINFTTPCLSGKTLCRPINKPEIICIQRLNYLLFPCGKMGFFLPFFFFLNRGHLSLLKSEIIKFINFNITWRLLYQFIYGNSWRNVKVHFQDTFSVHKWKGGNCIVRKRKIIGFRYLYITIYVM